MPHHIFFVAQPSNSQLSQVTKQSVLESIAIYAPFSWGVSRLLIPLSRTFICLVLCHWNLNGINSIETTFPHWKETCLLVCFLSDGCTPLQCKLTSLRPDFVITFLRTPNLPPTFAKFVVPLTFNKLDLRDYLFHAYGVTVLRVRSYVEQQKVQSKGKAARRWYRPRAVKKMTVEMDKPFVWPEEPTDFSAYVTVAQSAQDDVVLIASC